MSGATPWRWRWRVGVADRSHRSAVAALRRAAYLQAAQFDWNDEATLDWGAADEAGIVLAVWDAEHRLLSTTRLSVFHRAEAAQAFLEYSLDGIELPLPTLVLSRVATAPAAAGHGLFALLRLAYLGVLARTPIESALAITYEGAPHVGSMRAAGYEFFEPRAAWDTEAVARTRPLLAVLARARFAEALASREADPAVPRQQVSVNAAEIAEAISACCHAGSRAPLVGAPRARSPHAR